MKITNKFNIDKKIYDAVIKLRNKYDNGGSDLSCSKLLITPRQYWLSKRHYDNLEVDISMLIKSSTGSLWHNWLEECEKDNPNVLLEKRVFKTINGILFSGQNDHLDLTSGTLSDYKHTSSSSYSKDKKEWEYQLNALRWLLHQEGYKVKKLQINAIFSDWTPFKAEFSGEDYPPSIQETIEIPKWTLKETEQKIKQIIDNIFQYKTIPDDQLPLCSLEDRWGSNDGWAVIKKGNKRASKVFDNEMEAKIYLSKLDGKIEFRPGEDRKCKYQYCDCWKVCDYYQEKYGDKNEPKSD